MAKVASFMYPPFLSGFIDVYRQQPCLWRVRCREYSNKQRREEAWRALTDYTLNTIPGVDVEFIKKRVEILRASVRKETNRVRASRKSGIGPVHVPKLWYYDLMSFVNDQHDQAEAAGQQPGGGVEDDQEEDSCSSYAEIKQEPDYEEETTEVAETSPMSSDKTPSQQCDEEDTVATAGPSPAKKRKRQRQQQQQQQQRQYHIVLTKPETTTLKEQDEYDAFGKTVAAKLRRMDETQRIHADKLISDVLYMGLLEELSASTSVVGGTKR